MRLKISTNSCAWGFRAYFFLSLLFVPMLHLRMLSAHVSVREVERCQASREKIGRCSAQNRFTVHLNCVFSDFFHVFSMQAALPDCECFGIGSNVTRQWLRKCHCNFYFIGFAVPFDSIDIRIKLKQFVKYVLGLSPFFSLSICSSFCEWKKAKSRQETL